jgi:hypothetical protein
MAAISMGGSEATRLPVVNLLFSLLFSTIYLCFLLDLRSALNLAYQRGENSEKER